MDEKLQKLKDWIAECDNIVFFGGAGVSTEAVSPTSVGKRGFLQPSANMAIVRKSY